MSDLQVLPGGEMNPKSDGIFIMKNGAVVQVHTDEIDSLVDKLRQALIRQVGLDVTRFNADMNYALSEARKKAAKDPNTVIMEKETRRYRGRTVRITRGDEYGELGVVSHVERWKSQGPYLYFHIILENGPRITTRGGADSGFEFVVPLSEDSQFSSREKRFRDLSTQMEETKKRHYDAIRENNWQEARFTTNQMTDIDQEIKALMNEE